MLPMPQTMAGSSRPPRSPCSSTNCEGTVWVPVMVRQVHPANGGALPRRSIPQRVVV